VEPPTAPEDEAASIQTLSASGTLISMSDHRAERQLILLSAGTAQRRAAMGDEARKLIKETDVPRLTKTLRVRKLLPLLGPRIIDLAQGAASDDFAAAVEHALETARRHGAFLQLISDRVMDMLTAAGIRSTPLKGPLLGEAIYGEAGRRLSGDVDLLVAPDQLMDAVEVVCELGYEAPRDHIDSSGLPQLHFALEHERGELPPVELHWRIHWYERSFARERLLTPIDGPINWRPALADELAALLLFYARDGFVDVRLATDLSAWWDTFGTDVPFGALQDLLCAYPALSRPILAALRVARQTVGLPARQVIKEMPRADLRERVAVRLANPNPRSSRSQLYADMGFIDGLLTPPGGLATFVRRQILPPRAVLDQQARHAPRRRRRSVLARGGGVLIRYGLTVMRLARPPETLQ